MYEIVFLIDTNLAACLESEHCNEVILTVYRLLSSFRRKAHGTVFKLIKTSSDSNKKCKRNDHIPSNSDVYMKWGCKFFNTSKTIARNRSCSTSFKSFKLAHLEDFEKKLVDVFSAEKEDSTKPKSKTRRVLHPAELLSTALTETLHDFKWATNDALNSPVTLNRSRSNSQSKNDIFMRKIFVFAKMPLSKKSLRLFSNKMVLDSDVFIDSFMSPALLHEYQQKMKISLNCVDFSSYCCSAKDYFVQDASTAEGLSIVKDAFQKLGGCFVPKDIILCCVPTTSDCAEDTDPSSNHTQIFSNFSSESLLSKFQENNKSSTEVDFSARLSCKSFQCLPVTLTAVARNQEPRLKDGMATTLRSSKTLLLTETVGESKDEHIQQPALDLTDSHFTMLGCVPQEVLCDSVMTSLSTSYMLSCGDSSLVSPLLKQLASSRNVGLLCMTTKDQPSLMLSLLQAQNSNFGFISMLSLEATLKVEKALVQHSEAFTEKDKLRTGVQHRHSDVPLQLGMMDRLHTDIQKLKSTVKTALPVLKHVEESCIFQSHCLNSWHVPGCTSQMAALISKIRPEWPKSVTHLPAIHYTGSECVRKEPLRTDHHVCIWHAKFFPRLSDLKSDSEKEFLKQLQRHYMKEKHPTEVVQNLQPPTSTSICGFPQPSVGSSGDSESGSRSSHDGLRSTNLSRGRLMVNRARSANFNTTEDENESFQSRPGSPDRRRSSSVGLVDIGLTTEEDLKLYLHKQYELALNAGVAIETSIKTMVRVASQFISKTQQPSSPNKLVKSFITEHIIVSSSKLREKYNKEGTEENKSSRVNEYKLQSMLLLEVEAALNDTDTDHCQVLNELVSMLRALSFLAGITNLTSFLADIVASYLSTLPRLLVDIFDELMLPLPPSLAKFASPATPSSLFGAQLSVTNDNSLLSAPMSSQPASYLSDQSSQQAKRFQKFKQHPSISDFRQRKQILVKPKLKVETKKQVKDKIKTRSSSSRAGHGVDCERAKRNLFSDKTKPGSSKTKDKSRSYHRQRPSRSKTARTLVLGTPTHKQTSQRHLWKQERYRQRENIQPEVQVIAESPMKDDDDDIDVNNGNGDNSLLNRPARYIVREAFYSSNTQPSRSLARSLELAHKGDGQGTFPQNYVAHSSKSQGTLASAVRGESPILSPKSRLLKTFLSSPSPTPKCKWKHKRSSATPDSKQKHNSSCVTPLRRSPRKSAKKLLFKDSDCKNKPSSSKPAHTDYAHLIFDGENANDFDRLVSPTLDSSKDHFHRVYKTPEKQVARNTAFNSEPVSCPPTLLFTSSTSKAVNLSFKNILSSDVKDKRASKIAAATSSSEDTSTQFSATRSPPRHVPSSHTLSSSGLASRFGVSGLPKSPGANNSFLSASQDETTILKQIIKDTQSGAGHLTCTPTKGNKTSGLDQGNFIFTTPKKLVPSHTHTTPGKVKFIDSCLISPRTGSGYPPSLEKSTPVKSILKNSQTFIDKAKRRIVLQSVSSSPQMKHTTFMGASTLSTPWVLATSKEKSFSSSETEPNCSTHLLDKPGEAGQVCVDKPDPKACSDNQQPNKGNKITGHPNCRVTPVRGGSQGHTDLRGFDTIAQNSKSHGVDSSSSSSSEDISFVSCPQRSDLPAAVTICTPSSGSKPRADTINKWVRLKKSSPKNGSNSSSRLTLSPAYPSSSGDGRVKFARSKAHFSCLEAGSGVILSEGLDGRRQSKRRSLIFEENNSAVLSPSKRRKS